MRLVAPAALVQPGLLRALRRLLPAWLADAATEADVWTHADVRVADATGLVLHTEAAGRWRAVFADEVEVPLKAQVSDLIRLWHEGLPRELLRAETLVWHSLVPATIVAPPGSLEDACEFARRLEATVLEGDKVNPVIAGAIRRFGQALLGAMPHAAYQSIPSLKTVWASAFQGVDDIAVPPGIEPHTLYARLEVSSDPRVWIVR
jgi:hypothetical protein